MLEWARKVGYTPSDFDRLNVIHIAGTKGKGSTSAFVSSILCQYLGTPNEESKPLQKVGLYTSPHLRFVRERIQINNQPLSEELFAKYFFEVWDRLEESARQAGEPTDTTAKPIYFRYLTLMAYHTYLSEGVDAAIIECGIGGEFDSTNIMTNPVVTGITSLGIDHVSMLGDTIDKIAWHKAGIMKKGAKTFTAPQLEDAMAVLEERATEKEVELQKVDIRPDIASGDVKLGLDADFQKINASLAVAIADDFLIRTGYTASLMSKNDSCLAPPFKRGLQSVHWAGRCETRIESPNLSWYIDGGHTLESIELAGNWFSHQLLIQQQRQRPPHRVLVFNQADRDASSLARRLHSTLSKAATTTLNTDASSPFDTVIFCTNTPYKSSISSSPSSPQQKKRADLISVKESTKSTTTEEDLPVQNALAKTWREIDANEKVDVRVVVSIEEAVEIVRGIASASAASSVDFTAEAAKGIAKDKNKVTALVTGSLHLVGGLLEVLESVPPP